MPITLQSTIGGFDADFRRQLPQLEVTMEEHGLEPSDFVIAKNTARFPVPYLNLAPEVGGQYDYTVFVRGESFTVTQRSDKVFLDYFTKICFAENTGESEWQKLERLLERLKRWLRESPNFLK
jgi:hypothetical protein